MQQGLTSANLAFAIANLVSSTAGPGVPYIAALPHICEAFGLHQALEKVRITPHASARFYLFCASNDQFGAEVVPDVGIFADYDYPSCHTNHFVYPDAMAYEGRTLSTANSRVRLASAHAYIDDRDVPDRPHALLRRFVSAGVTQTGAGDADSSNAVFLLEPQTGTMYYYTSDQLDSTEAFPYHISLKNLTEGETDAIRGHQSRP
jgi:hypothetical protein